MSISQPCFHGKELIGIMGVDLHMEDVVQDVTYYNQELNSYIFLITTEGKFKLINVVIDNTELITVTVLSLWRNTDVLSTLFPGYTIMHPAFNRPMKTRIQPMHTDIWHFENKDGFARIRSDMLK